MVWELRNDGCWYGRWSWSQWEAEHDLRKLVSTRRLHSGGAWGDIEISNQVLHRVVEYAAELSLTRTKQLERGIRPQIAVSGLGGLALVCRAWYAIVAPALYTRLELPCTWTATSRQLSLSTAQTVRMITVQGAWPCITHTTLSRHYPSLRSSLVSLSYHLSQGTLLDKHTGQYHPAHAVIYAQHNRLFRGVVKLELSHCRFLSSLDLLRLLTSFPALEHASFTFISVVYATDVAFVPPGNSPSRLRLVEIDASGQTTSFIVHCIAGKHSSPHHQVPPFCGLSRLERVNVARICGLMGAQLSSYQVDAMDSNGETCTCRALAEAHY